MQGEAMNQPHRHARPGLHSLRTSFFKGVLISLLFYLAGTASIVAKPQTATQAGKCPPGARLDSVKDKYGAVEVADPYRWLEAQESKETRAWIEAQQKCTEAALGRLAGREQLSKRIAELLNNDAYELPMERGGRYFYRKRPAGSDLRLIYMRNGVHTPEEVLIDPLPWSADHAASVVLENVSLDGKFLYYGRRDGGQDEVALRIFDVDKRSTLPDALPKAQYFSVEPTPDDQALYYTKATPDGPRAYYHRIGADPAKDRMIYGENLGKDKILAVQISHDGDFLVYVVVYGSGSEQTELYVQNLKTHGPVVAAATGEKALFFPTLAGNRMFVLTNWRAPLWRALATDLAEPQRDHWQEVVPEDKIHLEWIAATGGRLLANYTHNASAELKVFSSAGKFESTIELPALGTISGGSGRWETPELFYSFESYNYAPTIFRAEIDGTKSEVWVKENTPFDAAGMQVQQVWYSSKDGTRVPMFLFHKKGVKQDGAAPVLLSGYGGFDLSTTPTYWPLAVEWVERGGIYAEANLRGGGEFGEAWHHAGMFEKKQNVFDDFFAAAEFLIAQKYTSSSRLAILGGSNGGLLMGASLTQRPDLYRAVVCTYPLLDMLRYQKFLEGPYWVVEYGSAENPEQFAYLYKYSPYHHVQEGARYPATLFVTGDNDTRVAPLHARKMAARMQAAATNGPQQPILLLYDTKSGHSGGRPVAKQVEEYTDILSFLFWQLNVAADAN
jgi:prolyl oligopeptidase